MALITVTFNWSDEHGLCYDCGRPAAYRMNGWSDETGLYCSVCAMSHTMEGEQFTYLFADE
jgi:hypothetical protein